MSLKRVAVVSAFALTVPLAGVLAAAPALAAPADCPFGGTCGATPPVPASHTIYTRTALGDSNNGIRIRCHGFPQTNRDAALYAVVTTDLSSNTPTSNFASPNVFDSNGRAIGYEDASLTDSSNDSVTLYCSDDHDPAGGPPVQPLA